MTAGQTPNTMGRTRPAPIEKIAIRGCVHWLRVNREINQNKALVLNGLADCGLSRCGDAERAAA